jgi:hypothetical protein
MASLIARKKGNQLYYYVVESARVDGQPRIVHQSYLGSAEKVAALVRDRTAPVPRASSDPTSGEGQVDLSVPRCGFHWRHDRFPAGSPA